MPSRLAEGEGRAGRVRGRDEIWAIAEKKKKKKKRLMGRGLCDSNRERERERVETGGLE